MRYLILTATTGMTQTFKMPAGPPASKKKGDTDIRKIQMEAAGFEPCICTGRSTVLLCHAHQFELSFLVSYVLNYIINL